MKALMIGAAAAAVLVSGNVLADPASYFVERGANTPITIPAGVASNPGPLLAVLSKTLAAGNYLITVRIDGQSYGPNSGAVCTFQATTGTVSTSYTTVDTSSNWTALARASKVVLGTYSTSGGTLNYSCQKGYTFTNSSQFSGQMIMVPVP